MADGRWIGIRVIAPRPIPERGHQFQEGRRSPRPSRGPRGSGRGRAGRIAPREGDQPQAGRPQAERQRERSYQRNLGASRRPRSTIAPRARAPPRSTRRPRNDRPALGEGSRRDSAPFRARPRYESAQPDSRTHLGQGPRQQESSDGRSPRRSSRSARARPGTTRARRPATRPGGTRRARSRRRGRPRPWPWPWRRPDVVGAQRVGPMCHGANSSSPTPLSSLRVGRPLATSRIRSKVRRPTASTGLAVEDRARVEVPCRRSSARTSACSWPP